MIQSCAIHFLSGVSCSSVVVDILEQQAQSVNNKRQTTRNMALRAYLSNVTPGWSIARQTEVLAANVPGWPVAIYQDELRPGVRRARNPAALVERAALLRPTSRRTVETVHVASIGVMAWRADDFAHVLEALGVRRATLVSHHEGLTFDCTRPADRRRAVELFPTARAEGGRQKGRLVGARRSAELRNAASKAAAEKVRDRWGAAGYTEKALVAETGFSRNTIVRWLGKWTHAVERRIRNEARAARKALEENR